jgi:hypothetical protein
LPRAALFGLGQSGSGCSSASANGSPAKKALIERDADPLFFAPDNMTGHAEPVRGEHQGEMFGDANGLLTSLQYAMTCNVAFLDHEAKWYAKGLGMKHAMTGPRAEYS